MFFSHLQTDTDIRVVRNNSLVERENMTRKHFEAIAATLKDYRTNEDHVHICRDLAQEFEALAPNFDKIKFMEACGYDVREDNEGYFQLTTWDSVGSLVCTHLMKL